MTFINLSMMVTSQLALLYPSNPCRVANEASIKYIIELMMQSDFMQ